MPLLSNPLAGNDLHTLVVEVVGDGLALGVQPALKLRLQAEGGGGGGIIVWVSWHGYHGMRVMAWES